MAQLVVELTYDGARLMCEQEWEKGVNKAGHDADEKTTCDGKRIEEMPWVFHAYFPWMLIEQCA